MFSWIKMCFQYFESFWNALYYKSNNNQGWSGIPTLLEFRTYRYKGHSMSDPAKYRSKDEVEEYKAKDPIEHVRSVILTKKYAKEEDLKLIEDKIKAIVKECVEFAENSAYPDPSEAFKDVYFEENYPYTID